MKKYNLIVIAIDQSYKNSGISIGADHKLLKVQSTDFPDCETETEKREFMRKTVDKLVTNAKKIAKKVIVITERIRTKSQYGDKGVSRFGISMDYIMKTAALVSVIKDAAAKYNVPTYSVDTRSWKAKIVGSAKAKKGKNGEKDTKTETVEFVQKLGFDLFIRTSRPSKKNPEGIDIYDDDAADSACMCLYGFLPSKDRKLTLIKI